MLLAGQKIGVFGEMHPLVITQLRIGAAGGGSGAALWRAVRIFFRPSKILAGLNVPRLDK